MFLSDNFDRGEGAFEKIEEGWLACWSSDHNFEVGHYFGQVTGLKGLIRFILNVMKITLPRRARFTAKILFGRYDAKTVYKLYKNRSYYTFFFFITIA